MMKKRTDGDGMESIRSVDSNREGITPSLSESENLTEIKVKDTKLSEYTSPNPIKGRLIELTPKHNLIESKKKQLYSKGPKFVPYEPYLAAIRPILPTCDKKGAIRKKTSRNNMDINVLISQMSQIDTAQSEFKKRSRQISSSEIVNTSSLDEWNINKKEMQEKIDSLTSQNHTLTEHLTQQVQVNKELKTMLVASMGEDLETQVQTLNDDKRHLVNELFSSAQHLSTHQEQTEWLAGQCEVWRSKFLASSLMVEELANWKYVLRQRTDELQLALEQMLEERCRLREMLLHTYSNLQRLQIQWLSELTLHEANVESYGSTFDRPLGHLNFNTCKPHTSNVLHLASANLKVSQNLSSNVRQEDTSELDVRSLCQDTDAEIAAQKLLSTPFEVKKDNDIPLNALVHHAHTKTGDKPNAACCIHCNGKFQLL